MLDEEKVWQKQINYYIMREMKQVIFGRKGNSIYKMVGIERNRYTKVLDGGNIRLTRVELSKIHERTDLDVALFTGEKTFLIGNQTEWQSCYQPYVAKRRNYARAREKMRIRNSFIRTETKRAAKIEERLQKPEAFIEEQESKKFDAEAERQKLEKIKQGIEKAKAQIAKNEDSIARLKNELPNSKKAVDASIRKQWERIEEKVKVKERGSDEFYKLCYYLYWNQHTIPVNPADVILNKLDALGSEVSAQSLYLCKNSDLEYICKQLETMSQNARVVLEYKILEKK